MVRTKSRFRSAFFVRGTLGTVWSRLVPYSTRPLIGYGVPVIIGSISSCIAVAPRRNLHARRRREPSQSAQEADPASSPGVVAHPPAPPTTA